MIVSLVAGPCSVIGCSIDRIGSRWDVAPGDAAAGALMAADIKRFLERPLTPINLPSLPDAPPGAPIGGDPGMDWLAPVGWCTWELDRMQVIR
jgi:hypothetical protein